MSRSVEEHHGSIRGASRDAGRLGNIPRRFPASVRGHDPTTSSQHLSRNLMSQNDPQRRHPALVPLSHDHHHGLVAARRLRGGEPARGDVPDICVSLRLLWEEELREHFRREEELLAPALAGIGELAGMIERMVGEHRLMLEMVERCDAGALGELLEAHIRFEERELFPLIQRELSPEQLDALGVELGATGDG
jgi:hypothetical protein